jgi:hypothetical protein
MGWVDYNELFLSNNFPAVKSSINNFDGGYGSGDSRGVVP